MLSSYETFLSISLKKNNFNQSKTIKQFFGVEAENPEEELAIAEKIYKIHRDPLSDSSKELIGTNPFSRPSIEIFFFKFIINHFSSAESISSFRVLLDLALNLNQTSSGMIKGIVEQASSAFSKWKRETQTGDASAPRDSQGFFERLKILLEYFYNQPLSFSTSLLYPLPKEPEKMKRFLTLEEKISIGLNQLCKAIEVEGNYCK